MDLQRRLVDGGLSEVLGEAAYETDLFYRTIGLYRGAQKSLELLQKVARGDAQRLLKLMEAYSEGRQRRDRGDEEG
jgi:penicillin amidase